MLMLAKKSKEKIGRPKNDNLVEKAYFQVKFLKKRVHFFLRLYHYGQSKAIAFSLASEI